MLCHIPFVVMPGKEKIIDLHFFAEIRAPLESLKIAL